MKHRLVKLLAVLALAGIAGAGGAPETVFRPAPQPVAGIGLQVASPILPPVLPPVRAPLPAPTVRADRLAPDTPSGPGGWQLFIVLLTAGFIVIRRLSEN